MIRKLKYLRDKTKGDLGVLLKGLWYMIEVVDACPMRCPTCPTGVEIPRDGHKMDLQTFRRILDLAQFRDKVQIRQIQLYRWSDALLHPRLHEFIWEAKRRGIGTTTSSVLQTTNCDFQKVFDAGPAEFRISFSGWRNMEYYQKNAKPDRFWKKVDLLDKLKRNPETRYVMYFHQYKDNLDETDEARKWAEHYGYDFITFPATNMNYPSIINDNYTPLDKEVNSRLLETPEENIARIKNRHLDYCRMQEKEVCLDTYGNMQQCQLLYNREYVVGNYLVTPLKEMREKIMKHPICLKCKAKGVGDYSLIFGDPVRYVDPVPNAQKNRFARKQPWDQA